MEMAQPILIGLRHSRVYGSLFHALHLLVLAALLLPAWPWWLPVVGVPMLGWSWWHGQRLRQAETCSLWLRGDGVAELVAADGGRQQCDRLDVHFVHPLLTSFALTVEGRRQELLVLPDSLPAEEFRRLRLWLRWRSRPVSDASSAG